MIVGATEHPYAWDPHLIAWPLLAGAVALVVVGHRRLMQMSGRPIPWTRNQMTVFVGAIATLAVAVTWPVADLAAHWSLTALVAQRMILLLAVAPLVLLGVPYDVIQWLTRPPPVDAVLARCQRPPVAIIMVTVLLVGSMTPASVHAQSVSPLARGVLDAVIVVAGLILWIPVLGRIPGIPRLKPVVRFGYLVAQAVVPAFLSSIYILSTRPLYGTFSHSQAAIDLRPLNDQQVAGFVSKLSMLFVLLTVGAVVLARAPRSDEEFAKDDPLLWADVERQFERADRQSSRGQAAPSGQAPSVPEPSTPAPPPAATTTDPPTPMAAPDPDRPGRPGGPPDRGGTEAWSPVSKSAGQSPTQALSGP
jgi:cytochrome c oxidase assembly factor CtaG